MTKLDDTIRVLETKLEAAYEKRRGNEVLRTTEVLWVWCFDCGKTKVDVGLAGEWGPHARDGRCPSCQEARRKDIERADSCLAHGRRHGGLEGPEADRLAVGGLSDSEIARYQKVAGHDLYEPPAALAALLSDRRTARDLKAAARG